jgi:hypothetical protein
LLLLLPGLTAGYTALAAAIGGLGPAILRMAGPLALLGGAGALAYGYGSEAMDSGVTGTTATNSAANSFFKTMSGLMNTVLPGNPYSTQKYDQQVAANEIGDVLNAFFNTGTDDSNMVVARANYLLGSPGQAAGGANFSEDELKRYIQEQAAMLGVSINQYIDTAIKANPNTVQDPLTGTYMSRDQFSAFNWNRAITQSRLIDSNATTSPFNSPGTGGLQNATSGATIGSGRYYGDTTTTDYNGPLQRPPVTGGAQMGAAMGSTDRAAPMVNAGDLATFDTALGSLEAYREALRAGRVELELLNGAQMNSQDAQMTFKVTQDTLIESQQEFNHQQSEYQTQLSALESGYDILNQRREDGIELSEEEQGFMDRYAENQERLTGGTEDAILAQAMLADQYAQNMLIGDQLNENMETNSGSVDALTASVNALIVELGGVPPSTDAEVTDNGTAAATKGEIESVGTAAGALDGTNATVTVDADTSPFYAAAGSIVGSVIGTAYVNVSPITSGLDAATNLFGMHGLTMMAHGGTAFDPLMPRFANGGTYALVGEVGPELVKLSRGDQVMPAGGSRAVMDRGRGRSGAINVQNLYLYPASPDVDGQIRAAVLGEWR